MRKISFLDNLKHNRISNKSLVKKINISNKNPHDIIHILKILTELEKEGKIKISPKLIQN